MWFDVLLLEGWSREAVYTDDRSTFLFWEHTIKAVMVLNPAATAAGRFPPAAPTNANTSVGFGAAGRVRVPPGSPAVVRNARPNSTWRPPGPDGPAWFPAGTRPRTDLTPAELGPDGPETGIPIGPGLRPGGTGTAPRRPAAARPRVAAGLVGGSFSVSRDPADGHRGNTVPHTDLELRNRLRRPRRQLLAGMWSGPGGSPEFMLHSPLPGCDVDARVGPVVKVLDAREIHGNVTGVYQVEIVTWEAPALEFGTATTGVGGGIFAPGGPGGGTSVLSSERPGPRGVERSLTSPQGQRFATVHEGGGASTPSGGTDRDLRSPNGQRFATIHENGGIINNRPVGPGGGPGVAGLNIQGGSVVHQRVLATPALLSNRWSMTFKPDPETWLMTQNIVGEAIFRADVLALRGLTADQLRGQIWHPIPAGYVRSDVDVQLSPDGLGVKYETTDRQQLMNFPAGALAGLVRMKVEQEIDYSGYDAGG